MGKILTEEQRIKRTERNRKRRAELTEEQRMQRKEYDRKRRTNMTEEQRIRRNEYERKRLANLTKKKRPPLTEEQRMRKRERDRERRANFLEEDRLQKNERERKRRAKLTKERRMQKNELERIKLANLSEEQRTLKKKSECKRLANLTIEEQRIKRREYNHKWRAKLTEEQRINMREKQKEREKQRPPLTEEQLRWKRERDRFRINHLTTEQRLRKNELERIRQAKLIEKQHRLKNENQLNLVQNKFLQYPKNGNGHNTSTVEEHWINIPKVICNLKIEYDEEQIGLENETLLQKLIEQMYIVENTTQIDENLLRKIMQMLGLSYHQIPLQSHRALQKLNYEIESILLIALLEKWKGWIIDNRVPYLSSVKSYKDLFYYLQNNFIHIRWHRDMSLLEEVNNYSPPENYIDTSCSLKQLKSLFYHSPHNHITYYRDVEITYDSSSPSRTPFPHSMLNLPYISTQITFPNFSIEHLNVHTDEYHLLDIAGEIKSNFNSRNNRELFSEKNDENNVSDTYLTEFIAKFLSQLKIVIKNSNERNMLSDRKTEIITAIAEFEKDIAHCTDTIQTNTTYTINLSQNPYARYLGHPDDEELNISIAKQKLLNERTLFNVRLQEIRYPKISFELEKFCVPYELINNEIHFIFNESYFNNINGCILYKCLLCDEDLGSYAPSQRISDHLSEYHGPEPDWECVKCSKSFSNDSLIKHRWAHHCQSL